MPSRKKRLMPSSRSAGHAAGRVVATVAVVVSRAARRRSRTADRLQPKKDNARLAGRSVVQSRAAAGRRRFPEGTGQPLRRPMASAPAREQHAQRHRKLGHLQPVLADRLLDQCADGRRFPGDRLHRFGKVGQRRLHLIGEVLREDLGLRMQVDVEHLGGIGELVRCRRAPCRGR